MVLSGRLFESAFAQVLPYLAVRPTFHFSGAVWPSNETLVSLSANLVRIAVLLSPLALASARVSFEPALTRINNLNGAPRTVFEALLSPCSRSFPRMTNHYSGSCT
jgi:hypothetical protein